MSKVHILNCRCRPGVGGEDNILRQLTCQLVPKPTHRKITGGASDNNTNNAIVFGHSGLEWPSVDAPAALGPNGPWAAGASTLGHSIA